VERVSGPYRVACELAKYNNNRKPTDGPPDEVVVISQWFEADGTLIEDPERIAGLERDNPIEGVLQHGQEQRESSRSVG
jgi:hypothetical protein